MKKFIFKSLIFSLLVLTPLLLSLFFLPSPNAQNSVLGALPDKHVILKTASSPKIILVGGSNVCFSFNSKKIADAFHLPVINMGLTKLLGLKFMLNDIKPDIKKGDIIVLAPEYHCFEDIYESYFEGDEWLLAIIFDISPEAKNKIDFKQWLFVSQFMPSYSFTKIKLMVSSLFGHKSKLDLTDVYGRKSFNKYGDTYIHWTLPNEKFLPLEKCTGEEKLNPKVIPFLEEFNEYVKNKGATLIIVPPVLQATSYENQRCIIDKISSELKKSGLQIVAETERYKFDDKYFFNMPYHLNKTGLDIRTDMVIEDLKKVIDTKKYSK